MRLLIIFSYIITASLANPLLLGSVLRNKLKRELIEVSAGFASGGAVVQAALSIGIANTPDASAHTQLPNHGVHVHSVAASSAGSLHNSQAYSTGAQSEHTQVQNGAAVGGAAVAGAAVAGAAVAGAAVAGATASSSIPHSTGSLYTFGGNHNVAVTGHQMPVAPAYEPAPAHSSGWDANGGHNNFDVYPPPSSNVETFDNSAAAASASSSSASLWNQQNVHPTPGHGHSAAVSNAGSLYTSQAYSTGAQSEHAKVQNGAAVAGAAVAGAAVAGAVASSSIPHSTGSLYTFGGNHNVAVTGHQMPVAPAYEPAPAHSSGWDANGGHNNFDVYPPPSSNAQTFGNSAAAASASSSAASSWNQQNVHPSPGHGHSVAASNAGSLYNSPEYSTGAQSEHAQVQNGAAVAGAAVAGAAMAGATASSSIPHSTGSLGGNPNVAVTGHQMPVAPAYEPAPAHSSGWDVNGGHNNFNAYPPPSSNAQTFGNSAAAASASSSAASSWNQQNVHPSPGHGHSVAASNAGSLYNSQEYSTGAQSEHAQVQNGIAVGGAAVAGAAVAGAAMAGATASSSIPHSTGSLGGNPNVAVTGHHMPVAPAYEPAPAHSSGWDVNGGHNNFNAYPSPSSNAETFGNSAAAASASSSAASLWNQQNVHLTPGHGHSVAVSNAGSLYNSQAYSTGAQSEHAQVQNGAAVGGVAVAGAAGAVASSSIPHSTGSLYTFGGNHNVAVTGDQMPGHSSGWNVNGGHNNFNAHPPPSSNVETSAAAASASSSAASSWNQQAVHPTSGHGQSGVFSHSSSSSSFSSSSSSSSSSNSWQ